MVGNRTFVVLAAGGPNGLEVIRHPNTEEDLAVEKAEVMSKDCPGKTFYIAEVYMKVVTPLQPATEITRLE
jgi:hypothetical protein